MKIEPIHFRETHRFSYKLWMAFQAFYVCFVDFWEKHGRIGCVYYKHYGKPVIISISTPTFIRKAGKRSKA